MEKEKIEVLVRYIGHIVERAYTEATDEGRDPGDTAEMAANVMIDGLALIATYTIWYCVYRHRPPSREEKEKIRARMADEIRESVRVFIAQHVARMRVREPT